MLAGTALNQTGDVTLDTAIVMDCEFLTSEGAMSRLWCGPQDPDPVVAQIGLVRLGLDHDFPLLGSLRLFVLPQDRFGNACDLDPYFTALTGVTADDLTQHGQPLAQALDQTKDFAAGAQIWSWGKDEFNTIAVSCYVQGLTPPLPATQFGNARRLLLMAGMAAADINRTSSSQLADHYQIDHPPFHGHDALDDALSVAYTLQSLLRQNRLTTQDLRAPGPLG